MMVRKLLLGYEPPKSLAVESGQLMPSHFIIVNDAELLNVSIRRIHLFSRILLNKKNRRKFNL